MSTSLTLTPGSRPDGTSVLTAAGEIDMSNSADLAAAVAAALENATGPLVVDLTAVEYLDSAGLSILLANAERIEVVATPLLGPVLTICGLTDLTAVHGVDGAAPTA